MSSLIRPKKLTIIGSDGNQYPFLLKPQDDLRKDARLMDFNGMINKLLKNDSASRRRNLCAPTSPSKLLSFLSPTYSLSFPDIRTYAVVPLSEECGLCEWVNHTVPFRTIITKYYVPKGYQIFVSTCQGEDAANYSL
jgi:serine/threonine-protein kinase ATR